MDFAWDEAKRERTPRERGIDFEDAIGIFEGAVLTRRSDRGDESHWIAVGVVDGRELAVVYILRGAAIRIISARRARTNERRDYHAAFPG